MQCNLTWEAGQSNGHTIGDGCCGLGGKRNQNAFLLPINPMNILMSEGRSPINLSSILIPFVLYQATIQLIFKKSP